MVVQSPERLGLNDPGETVITRIVPGGAVHVSRGARTHPHAHYAWKIVIGLDAPLWFCSAAGSFTTEDGVRAMVIPPGLQHQLGSLGLSCAVFGEPGGRDTPWHTSERYWALDAARTRHVVQVCRRFLAEPRNSTLDVVDEVFRSVFAGFSSHRIDARVRRVLHRLKAGRADDLAELANVQGLSVDRLSHLVKQDTGMALRKHIVWSRLMALLSQGGRYTSIAAAAAAGGFSDHAHLTRTYRNYLGRLPSDFSGPPDVLRPW